MNIKKIEDMGLSVRHYYPSDFPTINAWTIEHNGHDVDEQRVPPCGLVVEDGQGPVCVLFAHLSNNIGIAFLALPIIRPGLQVAESRRAFAYAMGAMREMLRSIPDDFGKQAYTLMIAHASPAGAREMQRNHGFKINGPCIEVESPI